MICPHCNEPILDTDRSRMITGGETFHVECLVRAVCGSVGHQLGQCSCHGRVDHTEEGLTRRQAAIAAYNFFTSGPLPMPITN